MSDVIADRQQQAIREIQEAEDFQFLEQLRILAKPEQLFKQQQANRLEQLRILEEHQQLIEQQQANRRFAEQLKNLLCELQQHVF